MCCATVRTPQTPKDNPSQPDTGSRALQELALLILDQSQSGWDLGTLATARLSAASLLKETGTTSHPAHEPLSRLCDLLHAVSRQHNAPDRNTSVLLTTQALALRRLLSGHPTTAQTGAHDAPSRLLLVGFTEQMAADITHAMAADPDISCHHIDEPLAVLESLSHYQPHLIALHAQMQVCDCDDLTAMIRQRADFADTPILRLGKADNETSPDAAPISLDQPPDELCHALQAALPTHNPDKANPQPSDSTRRSWLLDRLDAALETTGPRRGGVLEIGMDHLDALRPRHAPTELQEMQHQLARLIESCLEADDLLAHDGPRLLLLSRTRSADNLRALADELMQRQQSERFGIHAVPIDVSIGGCPLDRHHDQAAQVLDAARRARMAAGPNHVGWADHGDGTLQPADLEGALQERRCHHVYQAIAAIKGPQIPRYQALLRMRDHAGFVHTAAAVLPQARQAGMLPILDQWSIKNALSLLAQYQLATRPLQLFVTQSAQSLSNDGYAQRLQRTLADSGTRPTRLVVDLTLEDARTQPEALPSVLRSIHDMGVHLCLSGVDDSHVALNLMNQLPLRFCRLAADPDLPTSDFAAYARASGLTVIATRVEHAEQLEALRDSDVDLAQGHSLAHPSRSLRFPFRAGTSAA